MNRPLHAIIFITLLLLPNSTQHDAQRKLTSEVTPRFGESRTCGVVTLCESTSQAHRL